MRALPLLLLSACVGTANVGEVEDDSGPAEDTSVEQVGEDTDATDDTGAPVATTEMTFEVEGQAEGAVVTVSWTNLSDDLAFGDAVAAGVVEGGRAVLAVPEPSADELLELDAEAYPGTMIAWYLPALHDDTDGDGAHSAGEVYTGLGTTLPVYLGGTLPPELASYGLALGWNALTVVDGEVAGLASLDAVPLEVNLLPRESWTIAGTLVDVELAADVRLTLFPGAVQYGQWVTELLYDEPLVGAWEIAVSGAPPDDHYVDDGSGLGATWELPISYVDNDASGGLSNGDEPAWPACHGEAVVQLVWLPPPASLQAAFVSTWWGVPVGWSALAWYPDSSVAALTEQEATALVIGSGSCSLE